MSRVGTLKYNTIIYVCLFIAFICAIASCIEPSSAVSETPKKKVKETVPSVAEPEELKNVDKYSVAQKYLDSIIDQIVTDNVLTYEMMSTWSTYSIEKMTYKKEMTDDYYRYEIELKVTGRDLLLPGNGSVTLHQTDEYAVIKLYMNMFHSTERNGYLIKSIDLPSEI